MEVVWASSVASTSTQSPRQGPSSPEHFTGGPAHPRAGGLAFSGATDSRLLASAPGPGLKLLRLLHGPVEVGGRQVRLQLPLSLAIPVELGLRVSRRQLVTDPSRVRQDIALVELQEAIQLRHPALHRHRAPSSGLVLRVVQIHRDDTTELSQLRL